MYNLSPTPFLRILTTSVPHALRILCLASFLPAFIFLLIGGIASGKVNPAIGLLPLFFSSVYSAMSLVYERNCTCSAKGLTGTPLHMMLDMLCGIGVFCCLITGWMTMGSRNSYNMGWPIIVSTYGTVFMLFNSGVHAYFVLQQALNHVFQRDARYSCVCAQHQYVGLPHTNRQARGKDETGPLLDNEGQHTAVVDYEEVV